MSNELINQATAELADTIEKGGLKVVVNHSPTQGWILKVNLHGRIFELRLIEVAK